MLTLAFNGLAWTPAMRPPAQLVHGRSRAEVLRYDAPSMQV